MTFLDALEHQVPLLADGATGTMLQRAGLPIGAAPERWNIENPSAVRDVGARYIAAGSDLICTNTFGGSRVSLKRCGLEHKFEPVNRAAVRLAREAISASGQPVFLLGSIGPTGEILEPYGEFSPDAARESFAEHASLLAAAGVDALVCETFADANEAVLAIAGARATELPVLASMTFDQSGRTLMGVTPEQAVAQLCDAGALVVGANCSVGSDVVENIIRAMKAARPSALLLAKPNAGLPQVVDGKAVYAMPFEAMAEFATRMKSQGVAVVGGCCGSTPQHIQAMHAALQRS
ncbi:MAG TPA: homocysteine S-methyltransferase family protein [Verrucomicrobiae bacterium]|nr:homocysteine S-methyltransferase family protein [Verrucomicrobiae bacterium]